MASSASIFNSCGPDALPLAYVNGYRGPRQPTQRWVLFFAIEIKPFRLSICDKINSFLYYPVDSKKISYEEEKK